MAARPAARRRRSRAAPAASPRRVEVLVHAGLQPLDAVGPLEVFAAANDAFRAEHPREPGRYALELVAPAAGPVRTASGYDLLAARRRRLEDGDDGLEAVAAAAGFGTAETLRRAFLRVLGVGPAAYRNRFQRSRPDGSASRRTAWPSRRAS